MNVLPSDQGCDRLAEHKLLIIRQQTLVAELQRNGKRNQASSARGTLYSLLDRLELMQLPDETSKA